MLGSSAGPSCSASRSVWAFCIHRSHLFFTAILRKVHISELRKPKPLSCVCPRTSLPPATSYKRGIKSKEKLTLLCSRQDRPDGQLHEEECELHFVGETQRHRSQKSGESSINRLESEQEVIPGRKRQVKRVESGCR